MNEESRRAQDSPAAPGWSIRPMCAADLAAVRELWQTTAGVGLSSSDSIESLGRHLARNQEMSQVAVSPEGRLVGAVLCGHDGVRGYVRHLAVAADCRGRGIGRGLVDRCLEGLRALGLHKCTIFVFADNPRGRDFWEHAGWFGRPDLQVMQIGLQDEGQG